MRIASYLLAILLVAVMSIAPSLPAAAADDQPMPELKSRDTDLENARKAIEVQNWKLAIDGLNRSIEKNPKGVDAQNLLGYSWRKSGNLDLAFKHYNEALRLDPRHRGTHEYIGEAYLMANNVAKAEEHLLALDKLCFFSCSEFTALKKSVEEYKRTHK